MTGKARGWAFRLLPVALLIVVAAVSWLVLRGQGDGGSAKSKTRVQAPEAWSEPAAKVNSDEEHFMDDLAERAVTVCKASSVSAAHPKVFYKSEKGLIKAAQGILERYSEIDTAALRTSGYLDLQGNVWGAIVSDSRGWVDMCTVIASENDESCEVRAVRLLPKQG